MKSPKVLIIGPVPPPYFGVSVATQITLKQLPKKGLEIIHLDTSDRRSVSNMGKPDFVNIYLALRHNCQLLILLVRARPAVVYLPISQGKWAFLRDAAFLFLAKLFRRKIVVHLRGGYFKHFYAESSWLMKRLIRFSLKGAAAGIVQGECLRGHLEPFIEPHRVRVIPNGLNPAPFMRNQRPKADRFIVLFLANLKETKGYLDVLRSTPRVIQHKPNVRFIFAGDWSAEREKKIVQEIIEREQIQDHVEFTGPVKGQDKISLLLSSDIFVFPTYYPYEGHPWVVLEAMAAGLPVITTDQGAIRETVINGETGFIIEKKNPKAIAEKILLLLNDDELRAHMGKASRERLLQHFTEEQFIEGLAQVFHEVISK